VELGLTGDPSKDPRAAARSNVFLTATLDAGARSYPVRIRNISREGALLEGDELPAAGCSVRLRRGHLQTRGEVAWEAGQTRGIRFADQVDVPHWIRRPEHDGQRTVDEAIADYRSGGFPETDVAQGRDTIELICTDLDGVCERLAAQPELISQLAEEIMTLDTIVQRLRVLANIQKL